MTVRIALGVVRRTFMTSAGRGGESFAILEYIFECSIAELEGSAEERHADSYPTLDLEDTYLGNQASGTIPERS